MIVVVIVAAVLVIGFFLVVRRFWWWYFGIDRAVRALEDIAESLRTLPSVRSYDVSTKRPPARVA
jgi:hypothetical protein